MLMSVQQVLMIVIAKPNAKIRLAITSVLANKDFMEMEGQAAQVKKNLEKSKIHVQSIDLFFLSFNECVQLLCQHTR